MIVITKLLIKAGRRKSYRIEKRGNFYQIFVTVRGNRTKKGGKPLTRECPKSYRILGDAIDSVLNHIKSGFWK